MVLIKLIQRGCTPHRIKEDDLIEIVRKSINKQIKLVTKLNDDLELISKNKKLLIKGDIRSIKYCSISYISSKIWHFRSIYRNTY